MVTAKSQWRGAIAWLLWGGNSAEKWLKKTKTDKKTSLRGGRKLCSRGIAAAKKRYKKWPSAYASGHAEFATYLQIPYIAGAGELVVIVAGLCGAGLGFLWFNTYPAQVFMGDVGALALGAVLGVMAVIVRQEIVLFIMGGVFVMETVSVMLQVASFKLTGRRIFRMAPIHHHFELKGWPEPKIIVRFWIITVILVLVGLATLKIR